MIFQIISTKIGGNIMKPIVETAIEAGNFKTLVEAVKATGSQQ